ncbi:OLC1v1017818C1 [Oldenlandia corymbosa var. corymbosa]|uniref:OLC1v1017818C1 n=1 Tax=Oldenlandia corymbosa var. corymbosa TaxID=529605 RepID=A0AAV1EA84_OLDCO|nr:OLC1v1017818C1 [Oldenlandia corymbosa var. corymbosa]
MWDEKGPQFLVGFDPSSNSDALKVPSKFRKHVDGTISGTAFLSGPSGNTWHANMVQQDGELLLQDGWADFVADHNLARGDSLLFRYNGDLHFTVQIFDESCCEKESALDSVCTQSPSESECYPTMKRERENSALLDNIVEGIPKRARSFTVHPDCEPENLNLAIVVADKYGRGQDDVSCSSERSEDEVACTLNNFVTVAVPSTGSSGGTKFNEDLLLTAPEAERVARSFTSSLPNFTKVMKRFNISGSYTLNVPYQFATAHLPKCKVKVVLHNLNGESWTINSVPTIRVQTSHTFCGGWLGFVRDNNINEGDFCIFELVKKCELRVYIIRVKRDGMDDYREKEVQFEKSWAKLKKISRRKARKISATSHNISLHLFKKVDPNRVNCIKSSQSRDHELVTSGRTSPGSLSSHAKGCISMKSAPEEKLAAELFHSHFPHFVKIMKKFNVSGSYTLNIPYQFAMDNLPSCRTEIVLRNLKGKCWTVNSIPTVKVRTLHTFCGGWMSFVRDNYIQMGDICIFEMIDKNEMRVHISRSGEKGLDSPKEIASSKAVGSLTSK